MDDVSLRWFLGTWILDPASCDYQVGVPPQSGRYRLSLHNDGVWFAIDWVDADGQSHQIGFSMKPDGERHPVASEAGQEMSLTVVDDWTLDSAIWRGATRIHYARRVVNADTQRMQVTQIFLTAEGEEATNIAAYQRQDT
ncbi:MAG: hypothetical protein AAFV53_31905 [Myxococcota bacterium]